MTRFGIAGWLCAIVLGIILFFTRSCNTPKTVIQQVVTKKTDTITVTRVDTHFVAYKVEVPVPGLSHEVVKHDTILVPAKPLTKADSSLALKDYYLKKFYRDSFTIEQAYVGVNFEVSQNKLVESHYQVSNKRLTVATVTNPPKIKILIGASVGYSINLKEPLFSPSLAYQNKADNILFISYDIFNRTPQIGSFIKIHL